jgi:hypothetical protein
MIPSENETWIIDKGDEVIHKKVKVGIDGLTPQEKLIYCVWVADYGMRNAGDLQTASDLYPEFKTEATRIANSLSLPITAQTFSQPIEAINSIYFDRFDDICKELQNA